MKKHLQMISGKGIQESSLRFLQGPHLSVERGEERTLQQIPREDKIPELEIFPCREVGPSEDSSVMALSALRSVCLPLFHAFMHFVRENSNLSRRS
jgi:hypothetical protein